MKLLLDMNLSQFWLAPMQQAGFEVVHWISISHARSDDSEIMHYAQEHGYTICTQDLDFGLPWPDPAMGGRAWCRYGRRMSCRRILGLR